MSKDGAKKQVYSRLCSLFPNDAPDLMRLCIRNDFPLGYNHPDLALELVDAVIPEKALADLRVGYVFISAYYFLLDSVADKHLENDSDLVYLSHLLSGAITLFQESVFLCCPSRLQTVTRLLCSHISENAAAMTLEANLQTDAFNDDHDKDRASIIGRSNSALLLYHILYVITDKEPDPQIIACVSDLIYYVQLGDDLGDWEKDFIAKRWTSLLRTCFKRKGRILSVEELNREIFVTGVYEEKLSIIIHGLDSVANKLESRKDISSKAFRDWLTSLRNNFKKGLTELVATKISIQDKTFFEKDVCV